MEPTADSETHASSIPVSDAESMRGRSRRSGQRRGPRGEDSVDERRRSRPIDRTGSNGFRDGLDHSACIARGYTPPPTGIIVARTGVAVMTAATVARRGDALLQCDRQHAGPHVWPDGEAVSVEQAGAGMEYGG